MSLLSFRWKVAISTTLLLSTVWVFLIAKEAVPHPATYLSLLAGGGLLNSGTLFSPKLAVDWTLAPDVTVKEEGVNVSTDVDSLDFQGVGATVTVPDSSNPNDLRVTISGGSGSGGTNDTPSNSGSGAGETTVNNANHDFSIGGTTNATATEFFFDVSDGSLYLNKAGAGIVVAPDDDSGSSMVLSEGTNDGSSSFTLKVDDAGLTDSVTCTIQADGTLDGSCPMVDDLPLMPKAHAAKWRTACDTFPAYCVPNPPTRAIARYTVLAIQVRGSEYEQDILTGCTANGQCYVPLAETAVIGEGIYSHANLSTVDDCDSSTVAVDTVCSRPIELVDTFAPYDATNGTKYKISLTVAETSTGEDCKPQLWFSDGSSALLQGVDDSTVTVTTTVGTNASRHHYEDLSLWRGRGDSGFSGNSDYCGADWTGTITVDIEQVWE